MVLLDIVSKFKGFVSIGHEVILDDVWDQLNRSFMFMLLIVCGTVTVVRQHAGNIIACNGFEKFGGDFVEDYCWTQGLYTIAEAYDKPPENIPYPGIIPEDVPACIEQELKSGGRVVCPDPNDIKKPTRKFHLWYQWVSFYFYLAGAAFYLPYLFYKFLGFEEMKSLVKLVHSPLLDEDDIPKVTSKAVTWLYYRFCIYMKQKGSNAFVQRHRLGLVIIFTKCLYLAVSVIVFWMTAQMFEIGNYMTYGEEWALSLDEGDNATTLVRNKLFPKMIACEIHRWGASGLEKERGFCVLAPNVINQYLFLIVWFCNVFTIACNIFSLIFAVAKLLFTYATYRRLLAAGFLTNTKQLRKMYHSVGTTGRVTLHIMGANVRPRLLDDILGGLGTRLHKAGLLEDPPGSPGGGGGGGTGMNDNDNDTLPLKRTPSQEAAV